MCRAEKYYEIVNKEKYAGMAPGMAADGATGDETGGGGDAGVTKVETFAEKLERLDAEAAEQSMTNAGFVAQIAQVVEGNAGGDTEKTAYDDAKLEVTEYFSTETDAGALSMSPRIFWSRESGFSTKFPALQAIHAQNSAITGSTCRAESGFNSANDILTKRKGTLGPALFKSLALGKLNPDHFPSAASIRKRKLPPSGYNETNAPNTPIAQLWEQKDALALGRQKKKSRR